MKFNWGTGITIAIILFMAFILLLVFKANMVDPDLEAPDYYEQEIEYQTRIDAETNMRSLNSELKLEQTSNALIFTFPSEISEEINSGTIHFFKPDNASHDKLFEVDIKNGMQAFPKNEFISGRYRVKVEWRANEKNFYTEKLINIEVE